MYLAAGRADTARATLTRLMEHHPDCPGGYYNPGNICRTDGDLEAARNNYHPAIQHQSDFAEAHINLCQILLKQGACGEAHEFARRAVECQPAAPLARTSLAGKRHHSQQPRHRPAGERPVNGGGNPPAPHR